METNLWSLYEGVPTFKQREQIYLNPSLFSVARINTDKISLRRKGLLGLQAQSITDGGQDQVETGTWRQELRQRPWTNAAYWLPLP